VAVFECEDAVVLVKGQLRGHRVITAVPRSPAPDPAPWRGIRAQPAVVLGLWWDEAVSRWVKTDVAAAAVADWARNFALDYPLRKAPRGFAALAAGLRLATGHALDLASKAPPMNVAYLINQYPRVSHSFIRREIAALEQRGVVVHRFSIRPCRDELADARDREELPKTTAILGSKARVLAAALAVGLRAPLRFLRSLRETLRLNARSDRGLVAHLAYLAEACVLLEELRRRKVQHLHAHFGTNPAAVALLCRLLGGPEYSFTVHGPEEFDKAPLLALDRKIVQAKFVVAISEFGRSQLLRLVQAAQFPKIQVVHCGLDVDLLNAANAPIASDAGLVCVGRLSEQKGHFVLLDALALLAKEGTRFKVVLVGGGELRAVIERRLRELGIESSVRITGFVSQERVVEELRAARALVLPSLGEGLPVVIMEAYALGRPILSTFIAGIPELVTPGQSGWLVPAGSVDALAAALRDVLACPVESLEKMAEQGRQAVRQRHDVTASAHRLAQLFGST